MIRFENILKTICKTSWRCLEDAFARRLEDILKLDQDVLKTSSEDVWLRQIYLSWLRRLEDAFWRQKRKMSSSRRMFAGKCLENYVLSSNHYLRARTLTWYAILSMTKVELDLISDYEMYLFFEKGMRDRAACFSKRQSKSNNKYLISYESKKPAKFIACFDKNNLYNYAISRFLPKDELKWSDPAKYNSDKYYDNSSRGFILGADLKYPKELHGLRNDYPLSPDKFEIKRKMLYDYH